MNKVFILGRLGADPELRHTNDGTAVANFNMATSEKWSDKGGKDQERTEWHRIVIFGKSAENSAKYLKKGSQAIVEGRIQTRQWEDRDGTKRYTTEIVAHNVKFLDSSEKAKDRQDGPRSEPEPDDAYAFFNS